MEHITLRKKFSKSNSENNLSMALYNEDSSYIFNSTMLSLQNSSHIDKYDLNEYKKDLEALNKKIQSAEEEIDNLNIENRQLTQIIDDLRKQNILLRKLTTTNPVKQKNTLSQKITNIGMNSQRMHLSASCKKVKYETPKNKITNTNFRCKSVHGLASLGFEGNKDIQENHKFIRLISGNDCKNSTNQLTKKRVLILADQQGKDIRNIIQKLVGDEYTVVCHWKTNARIKDIVKSCINEIKSFTNNDIVILIGGTNDRNPFDIKFSLASWLASVNNTNIIVSEIPFNRHLNESVLNYNVKLICNQFDNATFIDMGYSQRFPIRKFALTLSRTLLRAVLRIHYSNKMKIYLKSIQENNKKNSMKNVSTQTVKYNETNTFIDLNNINDSCINNGNIEINKIDNNTNKIDPNNSNVDINNSAIHINEYNISNNINTYTETAHDISNKDNNTTKTIEVPIKSKCNTKLTNSNSLFRL